MSKTKIISLAGTAILASYLLYVFTWPVSEGQAIKLGGDLVSDYSQQVFSLDKDAKLKRYSVKAGNHLFCPIRSLTPYRKHDFAGFVEFDSSAYVHPVEWSYEHEDGVSLDYDYFDWNKLAGLTGYLSRPNRNSVMIAWRWAVDRPYCFELAAYTNDRKGDWRVSYEEKDEQGLRKTVTVCAGERAWFFGKEHRGMMLYTLVGPANRPVVVEHPWRRPWVVAEINTWFGGANNAAGPFGGVPHRDLFVDLHMEIK